MEIPYHLFSQDPPRGRRTSLKLQMRKWQLKDSCLRDALMDSAGSVPNPGFYL